MITIACCLWDANEESFDFSRMYDERWVEKLYRGFARNLTAPFRFVCFSDIAREYSVEEIQQRAIEMDPPGYGALIEPLGLGAPAIVCGLDTVVTGNVDHLARYCLTAEKVAVPRDPFHHDTVCNGVVLAPKGAEQIFRNWRDGGRGNDMDAYRRLYAAGEVDVIDDLFPGHVVSYKGHAMHYGLGDARIVYFHGSHKPHELESHVPWIAEHWS